MFLSFLPFKSYINEKPFLFIAFSWIIITIYFSYLIYNIERIYELYLPDYMIINNF